MGKLTATQEVFIAAYLRLNNATAAYREAYDCSNSGEATINVNADRLEAYRVGLKEGRRMSLAGKMAALTERAAKFNTDTEAALDRIGDKVTAAEKKRDTAEEKHHGYYDTIIAGVDESVKVIDRLSNGPLPGDGEK